MEPPPPPVVALRNLRKRYGAVEALTGLDLTVAPGVVYGFLGRNGAGKSTALRIIMGITQPTAGTVTLFGQPVRGDQPTVRRRIGYVAQEQTFYGWMTPLRLARFLAGFYPTWDDAEFGRLLGNLDVPPDRRIEGFSGGTHAKLALAIALAHRPELLILDEPTAGMDPVARREFLELVRAQASRAGRTTLFSSHLIDEVEMAADVVGIVEGGRMLWEGPPRALLEHVWGVWHPGPVTELPPALATASVLDERRDGEARTLLVAGLDTGSLAADARGWELRPVSLEDAFVALVRRKVSY